MPTVAPTTPPITAGKESSSASLLEDLGGIFSNAPNSSSGAPVGPGSLHTAMAPTLVPQPMTGILVTGILCIYSRCAFVLLGTLVDYCVLVLINPVCYVLILSIFAYSLSVVDLVSMPSV